MAPIILFPFHPRQNTPTASPPQITLTVSRLSTTYTTTIGLGAATSPPINQNSVPTSSPDAASSTQTQPIVTPANESSNGAAVGGGVVGAVLGLFVVVLLLWWCGVCGSRSKRSSSSASRSSHGSRHHRQSRSWSPSRSRSSSRSSSDRSSDYPEPMGQRGGSGGNEREKEYVRLPKKASIRSHRDRDDSIGFRDVRRSRARSSRGGNTVTIKGWSRPKRRGSGSRHEKKPKGLAGWYVGTGGPRRTDSRRSGNSSRRSDRDWCVRGEKLREDAWSEGRAHISTVDD